MCRFSNWSKASCRLLGVGCFLSLGAFLGGCTPAFEGEYSDPAKVEIVDDRWNETDARRTAEEMIKSCLSKPWLRSFKGEHKGKKPIMFVDEVENATDEHIDTKALTERIRNELLNSGEIRFVNAERRQKILDEVKYQQSGAVDPAQAKSLGKQLGADFMLGGRLSSSVHTQDGLKTVTYQVNLNLTNLSTAEQIWAEQFLVKKRFNRSGSKW